MKTAAWAAAAVIAISAAAGCGSAHAAHVAARRSPAPLTWLAACQALRADMLANGGEPDTVTLHRLVARLPIGGTPSSAGRLAADMAMAWNGVGTSLWPLDAAQLARDCAGTGVRIPV